MNQSFSSQQLIKLCNETEKDSYGKTALMIELDSHFKNIIEGNDEFAISKVYDSAAISLILNIWTLLLIVVGISEVQQLSIGNTILNLVLPILIVGIPVFILIFIFKALNGM